MNMLISGSGSRKPRSSNIVKPTRKLTEAIYKKSSSSTDPDPTVQGQGLVDFECMREFATKMNSWASIVRNSNIDPDIKLQMISDIGQGVGLIDNVNWRLNPLGPQWHHEARLTGMTFNAEISERTVRNHYSAASIIHSMLTIHLVRNRKSLSEVFERCLPLLPTFQGLNLPKQLKQSKLIPSDSVLQRSVSSLDAAMMLYSRRSWSNLGRKWRIFIMTDSSPQAGYDFQVTRYTFMDSANISSACRFLVLCRSCADGISDILANGTINEVERNHIRGLASDWYTVTKKLQDLCQSHLLAPMAVVASGSLLGLAWSLPQIVNARNMCW